MTADEIYTRLVMREGLFAVAFFGHGKRHQRARCNRLWRAAMREAARRHDLDRL